MFRFVNQHHWKKVFKALQITCNLCVCFSGLWGSKFELKDTCKNKGATACINNVEMLMTVRYQECNALEFTSAFRCYQDHPCSFVSTVAVSYFEKLLQGSLFPW